jgi:translocation and assembly module TamB
MAEETLPARDDVVVVRRPLWQRIVLWIGIAIGVLALLAVLLVLGLNTQPGRRFIANQIGGYTLANGLNIKVGRIDGSLYGAMVLRDVRVNDQRGTFATSPELRVDWRPFAFIRSHVDVRSLTSPLIRVGRLPELKPVPTDPDAPTLPDIDIDVNRLAIDRLDLAAPVSGARRLARLEGSAHIADRRAQVVLNGGTIAAAGIAGGDRVALRLDAVPDENKLDIDLKLNAPANGLVAGMAGLSQPLTLNVDGRGSWQAWNGRLVSRLGGGELANLSVQARDGRFQVRGPTQPGLYLKGPVERLTSPRLDIALDATLAERVADTRVQLRSSALSLAGQGRIDLANSRFGNFKVDALLLTPGAIAPNLAGRSVRASVALDGPFGTPVVDYKVQAAALAFGEMGVEGLYAEGRARVNSDRILVPVAARAARVTGLNAAAGGLLTNVSINGDLAINNGTEILSDNLRLRSDRIDATAIVAVDMAKGRYAGALKGRVNDYRIDGIGIVNVSTDAELYAPASGGFGIRGRVVAQTSRIFNDGARTFLGGNAIARVNLDYTPQGIINFSNLRVTAPQFRVTNGFGRYDLAGPLAVTADAYSTQYGPLSARVTGSLASPVVVLRAARPGLGVGLAGVQATIRGQNGRYAIVASGGSNYGPFNANLVLGTAPRLTADIRNARFAGIDFSGRVAQTAAGPFAGSLRFAGSGVSGTVGLGAQGQYQRADVNARAYNAVIPGTTGLKIGRAIIVAQAVLYPNQPAIVADAQVANLSMGEFVLRTARAKVNYRGGNGTAQVLADGSSGVPFRVGLNARMSPQLWLAALRGTANGINFRTASPARIDPRGGTYRLQPTRIDFDQGSLRVAGTYGRGMAVQTRLDRLDLSVANAFVPGLGIGGTATGSLDFAQPSGASFPQADARISISNFTRSSLASVSTPVNVEFAGRLVPTGGEARALIRRGTTTVGRMVATLQPLGAGAGSWMTRLMAAPLGGGIRYNGPAGVLFSLGGFADQQLSGPIGVAADFSGRVSAPRLNGIVRASNLTYENETYGTRLSNMRLNGRFTNDRFELTELAANAGDGTVQAQGSVGLAADAGFPIDVTARLSNARLARSEALGATATGTIRVTNSAAQGGLIQGELVIPEARYQIIRQGAAEVAELTGVRRKSDFVRAAAQRDAQPRASPPGLFKLAIRIRADNQLYVSGMGLESEWEADMRVGGTSAAPTVSGEVRLVRGTYSFAGKRFEVTRGVVRFQGGVLSNPELDIAATTTTQGITATIQIGGRAQNPQLTFTSTPNLPQDEVLSRLLFGSSVTNLSATEAIQLASALNSLRGSGGGGLNPLGKLRSVTGIDRLRILGADEATGRGTALAAGQYITDDIYVEIITDSRGFTATQLEIALTKALSLLSSTGSFGGSNASLRYSRDY